MKSYGVTIQVKPFQQYFCIVLFFNVYFTKKIWDFFSVKKKMIGGPYRSKRSEGGLGLLPGPDCDSP